MRRRTGAFRPTAGEPLEARTVPTGLGGFLGGLIGGVVPIPQQDAFAVRRDFSAFEQTYIKDVRTILAPVGGTSAPSGNVTAFNAAVGTAIGTLNSAITKDLGNLTVNGPAEIATITGQTAALQASLAKLTPPANTTNKSVYAFDVASLKAINAAANQAATLVANTTAANTISPSTVRTLLQSVQSSFRTFNQAYYAAAKADLLGATPNTSAFTTAVSTALTSLNASIAQALPTQVSASLAPKIAKDLLTASPAASPDTSLQATLATITPPTSSNRFSQFLFNVRSGFAVASADAQVTYDITSAVASYNNGLY